ncbi:hypothetical protein PAHAL_2G475900 [Panicum hallii]|uniref:Uncharacterized protein n=1 Tax=Panicum hallii TaxID=206008 RepID=A0A2T8KT75_9POAL|nr:hypothetical protein PAHAL_2G475900 [Panicum hallii]
MVPAIRTLNEVLQAERAHRQRSRRSKAWLWLPRAPELHRICRFATLVPGVVSMCTATPHLSHAGLPVALEISLAFRRLVHIFSIFPWNNREQFVL